MSLRSRILTLYVLLALVAMVVGVANYVHSLQSLEGLVLSKLQAVSDNAASQILDRIRFHQSALARIAAAEVAASSGPSSSFSSRAATPRLSADFTDDFTQIEFRDARGSTVAVVLGDTATRAGACTAADAFVELAVPLDRSSSTIASATGRVRSLALLPAEALDIRLGRSGQTLVVERASGNVLYDAHCANSDTATSRAWLHRLVEQLPPAVGGGSLTRVVAGSEKAAGYVSLAAVPWVVLSAVDMAEFKGPYQRAQLIYLFSVLALVALLGGGFVLLAGHYMQSLAQVSAAADRIGAGDLMPWLPPPGRDEVGRLSQAMAVMLARLKRMMRQNEIARQMAVAGEVAAHLSHEIRNPLSSIKLNLQSVEREVRGGTVPHDLHHVLGICLREIERLDDAVTTILECGRPGRFEPRPCHLDDIVDESLDLIRPRLVQHGIELQRDRRATSDAIAGDPALLRAALLNLFLNAMDVMPRGGTLRVRSENALDDGGRAEVRLRVTDSGPGVRPDTRDLIFQPFFTTKRAGSGVGLPIAVQSVEAHGGRLYLETHSELDNGAEFVLALPVLPIVQRDSTTVVLRAEPAAAGEVAAALVRSA